jgi:hypothetical protein
MALLAVAAVGASACTGDDGAVPTGAAAEAATAADGGSDAPIDPIDAELASLRTLLEQPPAAIGSYVGALEADPDTYVAVVTDDERVQVYLCDGVEVGLWFSGSLAGDSFSLVHDSGATVTGALRAGDVFGTFTSADGSSTRSFVAATVDPADAGLFRADVTDDDGVRRLGGWIVADDGSQRGVVTTETVTDGTAERTTEPAPELDPVAATASGVVSAPAGPLPVAPVVPESLAQPVPTQATPASSSAQQPGTGTGATVVVAGASVAPTDLAASAAPTVTAAFTPTTVEPGRPSALTITVAAGDTPVQAGTFGIGLPAALGLVDPDGEQGPLTPVTTTCTDASAAPTDPELARPGDPTVSVVGIELPAAGSCTVTVTVSASAATAARIATGELTSRDRVAAPPATATLTVRAAAAGAGATAPSTTAPSTPTTAPSTPTTAPSTTAPSTPTTAPAATTTTAPAATTTTAPSQARETPVLFVSRGSGTSPMSVEFTVTGGRDIASWRLLFSDGSGATGADGTFPASVPKTFVNTETQAVTVSADLIGTFTGGEQFGPIRALVQVLPGTGGDPSARIELASPVQARRGQPGQLDVVLRSDLGSVVAGPFTIDIDVDGVTDETSRSAGWSCARSSAALRCTTTAAGAVGPNAAPLPALQVRYTVPATAPNALSAVATLITPAGPFPRSVGGSIAVPVDGFTVDAGLDQRLGNRVVAADGTLQPANVRLEGTATTSTRPQTFTWRQVSGPTLDTTTAGEGRQLSFEAPVIASTTTYRFEFVVDDGVTSASDTVVVTLDKVNAPPVIAEALPTVDATTGVVDATAPVELSAKVSDADGDALTATWSVRVLAGGAVPAGSLSQRPISDGTTTARLAWPIPGVQQVEVTLRATDSAGVAAVHTVVVGRAPASIGLSITGPTQAAGGERIRLTANATTPSTFQWRRAAGPSDVNVPASGSSIDITLPPLDAGSATLRVEVIATPTNGIGGTSTASTTITITPGGRLDVDIPPVLDVARGASVQLQPTITGPADRTVSWTQTSGPSVTLSSSTAATPTFTAPAAETVLAFRVTVTAGAQTDSANVAVRVGVSSAGASTASGCDPTSVLARTIAGERTFTFGQHTTMGLGTPTVPSACSSSAVVTTTTATLSLASGFIAGSGLTARLDGNRICFVGGSVTLPERYEIDPFALSEQLPLCWSFGIFGGPTPGGGSNAGTPPGTSGLRATPTSPAGAAAPSAGSTVATTATSTAAAAAAAAAQGSCALPIVGELRPQGGFPFIDLGPGWQTALSAITFTCDGATFTATAGTPTSPTLITATVTVPATEAFAASVSVTGVPVLGGRFDATGSIRKAADGSTDYEVAGSITGATLGVPGVTINSLGARLDRTGLTVDGRLGLGSGAQAVEVRVLGQLRDLQNWSLEASVSGSGSWAPGPGLQVGFASISGSLVRTPTSTTFRIGAAIEGAWSPVPGFTVTGASIEVSNAAPPASCPGIAAGSVWIRAAGTGRVQADGVASLDGTVTGCLGLPTAGQQRPVFVLTASTNGGAYRPSPSIPVTLADVSVSVGYDGDRLALTVSGRAEMQGISLTGRLRLITGGSQQTVIAIDGTADLSRLGIGLGSGTLVFASGDVAAYPLPDGRTVAVKQGFNAIGVIDIGGEAADKLNQILKTNPPIQPSLLVTASIGSSGVVLTGAISLGANGLTLFATCPTQSTRPCDPNGIDTTRLALTSAFLRLTVEGGTVRLGFGGQALVQLPPARRDVPAAQLRRDELLLDLEAFLQPPATIGLALSMRGEWRDALGIQGLVISGVALQGTVDFTVPTAPIPTIGVFGEVTGLPTAIADLLGVPPAGADGRRGETVRFALNIAPTAPIVEITVGDANGRTFLRPLARIDGAATGLDDALAVDVASVVVAPLGGSIGTFSYPPGISARFGATLLGTPVQVQAVLDIANLRISASLDVGTFRVAGISMNQTRLAMELTPLSFRAELQGGVDLPNQSRLAGTVLVRAGLDSGTSPNAPTTTVRAGAAPSPTVGLVVDVDLRAQNVVLAPGNSINDVRVVGNATVDALSADVAVQLGLTARLTTLGRTLNVSGDATFRNGTMTELHARVAPGNITVGGVTLGGDGRCVSSLVQPAPTLDPVRASTSIIAAANPTVLGNLGSVGSVGSVGGLGGLGAVGSRTTATTQPAAAAPAAPVPPTSLVSSGATSGPCIQVDWVGNASPPVRFGVRGTLSGDGFTASVFGLLERERALLTGTVQVGAGRNTPALGRLDVTGTFWFMQPATPQIRNGAGQLVRPVAGDWRIDGEFAQDRPLGPLSAQWTMAMGRVSNDVFARFEGDVTIAGSVPVKVTGDVSTSGGTLLYDLRATSAMQADQRRFQLEPVGDTAIRTALFAAGVRFDSDTTARRNQQVRGSVMGVASYRFDVRLTRANGLVVSATGSARLRYAEGFRPNGSNASFTLEREDDWDTMVSVDLDVDPETGRACFVARFANQPLSFGAC